jgi:HEAT repeat protein
MTFASNDPGKRRSLPMTDPMLPAMRDFRWYQRKPEAVEREAFLDGSLADPWLSSEQALWPVLPSRLSDEKGETRGESMLVEQSINREVGQQLEHDLADETASVRAAAVERLGTLGEDAPVTVLARTLLSDPDWDVRAAAAQALGRLGQRVPVTVLIKALQQEEDESVQEALVRALGKQGNRAPVHLLVSILMHHESWLVREAASWALGELGERVPLNALLDALRQDTDEMVRAAAAQALGKLGCHVAEPALFEALLDEDEDVREMAVWALQQLDEETRGMVQKEQSVNGLGRRYPVVKDGDQTGRPEPRPLSRRQSLADSQDDPVWQQVQGQQMLFALTDFMKEKKGYIRQAKLLNTPHGQTLLIHCCYQQTEALLQEIHLQSLHGTGIMGPLETALDEDDEAIRLAVELAIAVWEERPWQDLFLVSFALAHTDEKRPYRQAPFRVLIAGMSYPALRKFPDTPVLDQIMTTWSETVREPLICQRPHDIVDLKVWHQSVKEAAVTLTA